MNQSERRTCLVPKKGLEPLRLTTLPFEDSVSTNSTTSAWSSMLRKLERVVGLEPTHSAWKADALPVELHPLGWWKR